MADQAVKWSELLSMNGLSSRTYAVIRPTASISTDPDALREGAGAIDLTGRQGGDWYMARKWALTTDRLDRLIVQAEARGFRFLVNEKVTLPIAQRQPWVGSARTLYDELSPGEKQIHRELFPGESTLLQCGYDWDPTGVTLPGGARITPDALGRYMETASDGRYEWVRDPDEQTWRRLPVED